MTLSCLNNIHILHLIPSYIVCNNCWPLAQKQFSKKKKKRLIFHYSNTSFLQSVNLTGCLRSFQKICEVKATFLIMVHCRLPFACVGVCADGVDTAEGEPRAPYRRRGTGADRPHRHSSRPSPSRAPSEKGKSSFTKECL